MTQKKTPRPTDQSAPHTPQPIGLFPKPITQADLDAADRIQWMHRAEIEAWKLIYDGRDFDAHTITERVGRPYPGDGRNLANIIRKHSQAGHITRADYRHTRRPTSGSVVAVWRPTAQGRRIAHVVLQYREAA